MAFLNIAKASTFTLNEGTQALEAVGRRVYKFGFGVSPFAPPAPVREALGSAAGRVEYTAVAGLPQLRENIAAFHQEVDGYAIDAGQVLVAPGTKPLLNNIMRVFQPAEVYLPRPSWISYGPQARLAGHDVVRIPTTFEGRWRLSPEALEQAVARRPSNGRQKLLVLNYPGNPDGLTYSPSELDALSQVLRRHEFWVVADEIYALLDHRGRHCSLASVYPARTLVTTGMSKWCGAGGWRLGALILPPDAPSALFDALVGLASESYSCAPAPIQVAALRAYELDEQLYAFLAAQRRILGAVGAAVHAALHACGVRAHAPQGGFYLLLDFSPFAGALAAQGIIDDRQLCDRLLADAGVALLPGNAFGMPPECYTARLAYVDFDGDAALRDVNQIEANVTDHAAKMLEGIDALGEWLRQLNSSR